ncbi:short chain dehydrogenase [Colwellia chukchiensis]|uniref:Short chain dehydrogenase n=1 Tax=Colwellia chukchiensis TaxID=641665 RepID=A0A1H7SSM7_9GAMM|nr:SDR family NAD(P)-dependent oxidoreductase [Colwellia chukchiensis]SEL75385.1 short chain dehydrogenase [Colwellia chukchiensis]
MRKTILITGSTDGIGLETAKSLLSEGHRVLVHGRNAEKLRQVGEQLQAQASADQVELLGADLSDLSEVYRLAEDIRQCANHIDVVINNAGIFKTDNTVASNGVDVRFMVNAIAPWVLTRTLLTLFSRDARVINLSSAAQKPVSLAAIQGEESISDDFEAYAQSKLALTMWSMEPTAIDLSSQQSIVAVNPGSMLGSKMVKEGFGVQGNDIGIGVRILQHLAVELGSIRSRQYFDNDVGDYAKPHPDAENSEQRLAVLSAMNYIASKA